MDESEAESAADDEDRTTEAGEGGKEKTKQELRAEKKKKLKEMFNADYDDGKGIQLFVLFFLSIHHQTDESVVFRHFIFKLMNYEDFFLKFISL